MIFGNGERCAAIEYHGSHTTTQSCVNAISRLVNWGDRIPTARLLTWQQHHAFLLAIDEDSLIVIPQGFTSGYSGEGPRGLATALQLLDWHGAAIEEYEVRASVLQDISRSCLKATDLDELLQLEPLRPLRWHDYVYAVTGTTHGAFDAVRRASPLVLPLGVIDGRLGDLVLRFRDDPDDALHKGYRRLEQLISQRIGVNGQAAGKLFGKAFGGPSAPLHWPDLAPGEQEGRAGLFVSTYKAFRNRRAHREHPVQEEHAVREFLLLNELFRLEEESVLREVAGEGG